MINAVDKSELAECVNVIRDSFKRWPMNLA